MTREETKKCIEVMQAYVDGKDVEILDAFHSPAEGVSKEWTIDKDPLWDFTQEYRIKQEPKPFDWRGKNIQWVREIGDDEYVFKVITHNNIDTIYIMNQVVRNIGNTLGTIEVEALEKERFHNYEWSEDNATWRRFE